MKTLQFLIQFILMVAAFASTSISGFENFGLSPLIHIEQQDSSQLNQSLIKRLGGLIEFKLNSQVNNLMLTHFIQQHYQNYLQSLARQKHNITIAILNQQSVVLSLKPILKIPTISYLQLIKNKQHLSEKF